MFIIEFSNLESFNPNSNNPKSLNSPRSIQACKNQGVQIDELFCKTKKQIQQMYFHENLSEQILEIRKKGYEELRQQKLMICIKERNFLIDQDDGQTLNFKDKEKINFKTNINFEKQDKNINKMKEREKKEIELIYQYEMQMSDLKDKNQKKEIFEQRKAIIRTQELQEKRILLDQIRQQKQQQIQQKQIEQDEYYKNQAKRQYERQQEFDKLEKIKLKKRKKQARIRDEERKQKRFQILKTRDEDFQKRIEENQIKRLILDEKDQERKQIFEYKKELKFEEIQEKQLKHEIQQQKILEFNEQQRLFQLEQFNKKEQMQQGKKQKMEQQLKSQEKLMQKQSFLKTQKQKNQNKSCAERVLNLSDIQPESQMKVSFDEKFHKQFIKKIQLDEHREQTYENYIQIITDERNRIQDKIVRKSQISQRAQTAQNFFVQEQNLKKDLQFFIYQDKVKRSQRQYCQKIYQKQELVKSSVEKNNILKDQQKEIIKNQNMIKKELEISKIALFKKYQLVKQGKLNPEEIQKDIQKSSQKSQEQPKKKKSFFNEKQIQQIFESQKQSQDQQIMNFIDQEYHQEELRELELEQCENEIQKIALEKKYAHERLKASQYIHQMQKQNQQQLEKFRQKYL